jgi:hypothetical protein
MKIEALLLARVVVKHAGSSLKSFDVSVVVACGFFLSESSVFVHCLFTSILLGPGGKRSNEVRRVRIIHHRHCSKCVCQVSFK